MDLIPTTQPKTDIHYHRPYYRVHHYYSPYYRQTVLRTTLKGVAVKNKKTRDDTAQTQGPPRSV